jgi:hypothetical protein
VKQFAAGVALAVAGLALGACGGSHRLAATTGRSTDQRALVVLRQLARCVRGHGLPSFPDPVVGRNGVPVFPDSAPRVPPATQHACRTVAARIPPDYTSTTAVSSGDFHELLAFARCVRAHGIPDWPDPNALGEFPIDTHIEQGGKRLFVPAVHACARLNPDPSGGIHVVRARP